RPPSEVALCAPIIAHYEALGWTVYQEVWLRGGARADLVLARGDELRVLEAKRGFTAGLLRQAEWWRRAYCWSTWVAVPVRVSPRRLALLGGLGFVRVLGPRPEDVHEVVQPVRPRAFPAG